MKNIRTDQSGVALIAVLVLSIVLVILTTAMVLWIQIESKQSVKHRQSTTAFHLAEAAVDRARWKLLESNQNWIDTGDGIPITWYNFDKAFADVPGGTYAISITSHATDVERRIVLGVGRDNSTKEVRRIYAEIEREHLDTAVSSGGNIDIDGNSTEVHWGPIKSQSGIDYNSNRFPRLYSRGAITPDPPYCDNPGCGGGTSDGLQYFAFYDVPPRPLIDFEEIKSSAMANGLYFTTEQEWNNAYPGGSCGGCPPQVSTNLATNKSWYFDLEGVGDQTLILKGGKYIWGTVIVMGKLELQGTGKGEYTTIPPSDIWREYTVIDTNAAGDWYGDAGGGPPSTSNGTFEFIDTGVCTSGQKQTCIKQGVSFRGLLYSKLEFDAKGNNLIHGIIIVEKDDVANTGNVTVFYNKEAGQNVTFIDARLIIKVWREEPGSWPGGL